MGSDRVARAAIGTALAVAVASPVAAATPAPPAGWQAFALAKDCSSFTGQPGDHCTITTSNIAQIPAGTLAIYFGPVLEAAFVSSVVVLEVGDGDTAVGYCSVGPDGSPLGTCSFTGGSGSLAGFQAVAAVTVDGDGIWHWDGFFRLHSGD